VRSEVRTEFGGKPELDNFFEDLVRDGRMIIKRNLQEINKAWTGLIWLMNGINVRLR
jgi:hypothetical protein